MTPLPARHRLAALVGALEAGLLERAAAVRLALLAALAGEHVLLIGPPGTAKSELARRLHRAFDGARYFERLLTRFSTPEELFGPLSLKALEDDRYERLTDGYLPTATIAFLDEVFKANSAILNALLTLLNEREFDNGSGRVRTPLVSVVGASNERPADDSLLAFHDRFLLRVPAEPVGDESFGALLRLQAPTASIGTPGITRDELDAIAAARDGVRLPDEVLAALAALRVWTRMQQPAIQVSDRRWRQLAALLRVQALTEGRAAVDAVDLWLVPYALASDAAQLPALQRWFAEQVIGAAPDDAPWLTRAVEAFEKQLEIEQSMPGDDGDGSAGKLALARAIGRRDSEDSRAIGRLDSEDSHVIGRRDSEDSRAGGGHGTEHSRVTGRHEPDGSRPAGRHGTEDWRADGGREAAGTDTSALRIVAAALEQQLRRRFSHVHIDARLAQLDEVIARASPQRAPIAARLDSLRGALDARLWLPPELARELSGAVEATLTALDALLVRLDAARAGFAALPVDDQNDAETATPSPVALSA